jgi:hypothetical protein
VSNDVSPLRAAWAAQQEDRESDGELDTELQDGRLFTLKLKPGMSYQVVDGADAHRSSTWVGATLFIVD